MRINPELLRQAVGMLDHVPQRTGIQSSEFVRLSCKKGKLEMSLASDLIGVASITPEEPEEFSFFIERKLLFPFISASKDGKKEFSLSVADSTLTLRQGRRSAKWSAIEPVKGYSSAGTLKEKELTIQEGLIEELRLAAKYSSQDQLSPELSCVWLDRKGKRILSTNKFSVFQAQAEPDGEGPIPGAFPDLLEEASTIMVSETGARIVHPYGYLFQAFNQKALSEFPLKAISSTMKAADSWKVRLNLKVGPILEILLRLANYISGASSEETIIRVEGKKGDPLLRLKTGTSQGAFSESLKLIQPPTEDYAVDWLLLSVRPFLEALPEKEVVHVLWDDDSPFLFRDRQMTRRLISPRKASVK